MEDSLKVIVFQLDQKQYGVNLQQVLSIERLQAITQIPLTSSFIKGVMNLRGNIIPVIDLREKLDLGHTEQTEATRVLIVQIDTSKVGLVVDTATDVIDLNTSMIEPAPDLIVGITKEYLMGVAKLGDSLLVLLDIEHVLNLKEKEKIQEAMS